MPATTFDFIRKVKALLMSQPISNSSFFAETDNNSESNHDSIYTYSTYYMLGTSLSMLYIIIRANIYLAVTMCGRHGYMAFHSM